jgi:hypothetical protein
MDVNFSNSVASHQRPDALCDETGTFGVGFKTDHRFHSGTGH